MKSSKTIFFGLLIGVFLAACSSPKPQEQATEAIDENSLVEEVSNQIQADADSLVLEADAVLTEIDQLLEEL